MIVSKGKLTQDTLKGEVSLVLVLDEELVLKRQEPLFGLAQTW